MKMIKFVEDLLKDYRDISYEIVDITTDEDESFKVIDLHSGSLESDNYLSDLFEKIITFGFDNELYEYLCNVYFYKESEEYKQAQKLKQSIAFDFYDIKIKLYKKPREIYLKNESKDFSEVCSEELEMAA